MRIVISGTVGVGKTTVSKILKEKLENNKKTVNFLEESTVKSIYLDFYYKSPVKWAFIAQIDFLLNRFKMWLIDEKKRELTKDSSNYITLYDRHFLDDFVFAELHTIKKNISTHNSVVYHAIYGELLKKMFNMNAKPDYFILLKADLENILKRLNVRGRDEEKNVNVEYWTDLYNNYYERPVIQNHFRSHVKNFIILDTNNKTPEQITEEIYGLITK